MPTNLPPEYYKIEKQYREAIEQSDKITLLDEMISAIPKHKGTDKLRADLRKKLSKLKNAAQSKKGTGKKTSDFIINKEGAGQVVVTGSINVGKSSLVAALTHADPMVSNSPFTTWKPIPGMVVFKDIQFQFIDTPPLNKEFVESDLFNLIKRADLIILMLDILSDPMQQLEDSVELLADHKIAPIRFQDRYDEPRGITFLPFVIALNKNDDQSTDENAEIFRELIDEDWPFITFSAQNGRNRDLLIQMVYDRLEIIRVYAKTPGKPLEKKSPFVLKKGQTVEDFASKVHKDFSDQLKNARIWGANVYDGQLVNRDHVLHDEDVVELHL